MISDGSSERKFYTIVKNEKITNISTMLSSLDSDERYRINVQRNDRIIFEKQFAIVDEGDYWFSDWHLFNEIEYKRNSVTEKYKIINLIIPKITPTTVKLQWDILENWRESVTDYKVKLQVKYSDF